MIRVAQVSTTTAGEISAYRWVPIDGWLPGGTGLTGLARQSAVWSWSGAHVLVGHIRTISNT